MSAVEGTVIEGVHIFFDHIIELDVPSEPCLVIFTDGDWQMSTTGEVDQVFGDMPENANQIIHQVIPMAVILRDYGWQRMLLAEQEIPFDGHA